MKEVYYLLDKFDPLLDYSNGKIISLNPDVSYKLDKRGIGYHLLDEYYSKEELIKDQDRFIDEQLDIIDKFDVFLRDNISFCREAGISPARRHHSRLTYLIGTVVISSRILKNFISKIGPAKIVYVSKGEERKTEAFSVYDSLIANIDRIKRSIMEILCAERAEIELELRVITPVKKTKKGKWKRSAYETAKKISEKMLLKRIYHVFKYSKFKKYFHSTKASSSNRVLFLNAGARRMDYLLRELIGSGSTVYLKDMDCIQRVSGFSSRKIKWKNTDDSILNKIKNECDGASGKIDKETGFYEWINRQSGCNVSGIVAPYMEGFIKNDCSRFLAEVIDLIGFYKKENMDLVVTNSSVGRNEITAVAAGEATEHVKNLCFQHSSTTVDHKLRYIVDEMGGFDYYFTTDDLSEKYFQQYSSADLSNGCKVDQYPYYFSDIIKRNDRKKTQGRKEKIVYVSTKLARNRVRFRSDNLICYPSPYYYEFLKKIIDFFGSKDDFDFVYKHVSSQKWAEASIIPYIEDKSFQNVSVGTMDFIKCLDEADRIIVDYPSTSLFEAADAGVPVLALCPDIIEIWEPCLDNFKKSFHFFSEADEAVDIISDFLDSDPKDYICKVPYNAERNMNSILTDIQSSSN